MSEHVKEGNKIQLSLNWPGKPEGNAKEVADFIGAKTYGLDGDLNFIRVMEPALSYRVTNLETYASTPHENIVKDGEWVELWKEQSEDEQLEQVIQDKGLDAPRITNDRINELMARVKYVTVSRPGDTTSTFVHAYLDGKFLLASGFSACVDPSNFDYDIGVGIAQKNAETLARQELWKLEGYRLYSSLCALEQSNPKYATGETISAQKD